MKVAEEFPMKDIDRLLRRTRDEAKISVTRRNYVGSILYALDSALEWDDNSLAAFSIMVMEYERRRLQSLRDALRGGR